MIRNLKVLSLAMAAMFAFAGLSASAASAGFFHSEQSHTIVDAHSSVAQTFHTPAGNTTCTTVQGDATLTEATVTQVTGTDITYSGCTTTTIFGKINVSVAFNECDYLFTTDYNVTPIHIVCPAGKTITITGPGCTISVPAQTLAKVEYTSLGSGTTRDILMHANVTGIKGSATGAFCSKTGEFTTGTYTGTVTFTGTNTEAKQIGIWYTKA